MSDPGAPPSLPADHAGRKWLALVAVVAVAYLGIQAAGGNGSSADRVLPATNAGPPAPTSPTLAPPGAGGPSEASGASRSGGSAAPGSAVTGQATAPNATSIAALPSVTKASVGVVDVETLLVGNTGRAAGTGMVLTAGGQVLTNNHVINGAVSISVTVVTTGRSYRAVVVGTAPTEDVAVLQLQGAPGLVPVTPSAAAVAVGQAVEAVGNKGGVGGTPSVGQGHVVALGRTITAEDDARQQSERLRGLIQTDVPLDPGDSGGPLLDTAGRVVGMDTAASTSKRAGAPVSFAIPIAHALAVAGDITAGRASATIHLGVPGFLGVALAPASAGAAVVTGVEPGMPAASAGIVQGDTITSVDGSPVHSTADLTALLHQHRPGDRVTIDWTDRAGRARSAPVTLAAGPAD